MPDTSVIATVQPARLLLIDGSGELEGRLTALLEMAFATEPVVVALSGGREALELLKSSRFDVVAADVDMLADLSDRMEERIAKLARAASGALILVLSDDASISVALAAMRAGAHDCVGKGADGPMLVDRMGELARRHGKRALLRDRVSHEASGTNDARADAPSIPVMRDLVLPMWRQEQRIIEDAIQRFAGNVAAAAAALELSPSTIYRKRQAWAESDDSRGAV